MKHPVESVTSPNPKAGDLVRSRERHGQWLERAGVRDSLMRRCPLQNSPNSRRAYRRRNWLQISVRSRNSRRQVCTLLTLSGISAFG
jgi:hypothetical protein